MSDKSSGGPNLGLLLIIPAAAIVTRAVLRHHAMAWGEDGEPGPGPARHGHRHGMGARGFGPSGRGFGPSGRGEFRLPPRIEAMLEDWHTRAHQGDEPKDETTTV